MLLVAVVLLLLLLLFVALIFVARKETLIYLIFFCLVFKFKVDYAISCVSRNWVRDMVWIQYDVWIHRWIRKSNFIVLSSQSMLNGNLCADDTMESHVIRMAWKIRIINLLDLLAIHLISSNQLDNKQSQLQQYMINPVYTSKWIEIKARERKFELR